MLLICSLKSNFEGGTWVKIKNGNALSFMHHNGDKSFLIDYSDFHAPVFLLSVVMLLQLVSFTNPLWYRLRNAHDNRDAPSEIISPHCAKPTALCLNLKMTLWMCMGNIDVKWILSFQQGSDSVVVSTSDSHARGPRFEPPLRQGNSFKFQFKFFY